jgi:hypothetical protein
VDSYYINKHVVDANGDGKDDLWFDGRSQDQGTAGVWINQYKGTTNIKTYELYK